MAALITTDTPLLIGHGAEGKIYDTFFLDRPAICKERQKKKYRVAVLDDKINKQRLVQEARCMARCLRCGVMVPTIYFVDTANYRLYLEKIEGMTLRTFLNDHGTSGDAEYIKSVAQSVGKSIAQMHEGDILHGDLTTSNIMLRFPATSQGATSSGSSGSSIITAANTALAPPQIVLIDFGLGAMQGTMDDKAVDLYVLERSFQATHPSLAHLVAEILEGYRFNNSSHLTAGIGGGSSVKSGSNKKNQGTAILQRLEQVRQRGRKRDMIG